jgi:hypothetical protein
MTVTKLRYRCPYCTRTFERGDARKAVWNHIKAYHKKKYEQAKGHREAQVPDKRR